MLNYSVAELRLMFSTVHLSFQFLENTDLHVECTYDSPLNNALLNPIFGFNEYLPLINLVTIKQSRLCTKRSKGFKCKTGCCAKA